jgi:hypothetical protein
VIDTDMSNFPRPREVQRRHGDATLKQSGSLTMSHLSSPSSPGRARWITATPSRWTAAQALSRH